MLNWACRVRPGRVVCWPGRIAERRCRTGMFSKLEDLQLVCLELDLNRLFCGSWEGLPFPLGYRFPGLLGQQRVSTHYFCRFHRSVACDRDVELHHAFEVKRVRRRRIDRRYAMNDRPPAGPAFLLRESRGRNAEANQEEREASRSHRAAAPMRNQPAPKTRFSPHPTIVAPFRSPRCDVYHARGLRKTPPAPLLLARSLGQGFTKASGRESAARRA